MNRQLTKECAECRLILALRTLIKENAKKIEDQQKELKKLRLLSIDHYKN